MDVLVKFVNSHSHEIAHHLAHALAPKVNEAIDNFKRSREAKKEKKERVEQDTCSRCPHGPYSSCPTAKRAFPAARFTKRPFPAPTGRRRHPNSRI